MLESELNPDLTNILYNYNYGLKNPVKLIPKPELDKSALGSSLKCEQVPHSSLYVRIHLLEGIIITVGLLRTSNTAPEVPFSFLEIVKIEPGISSSLDLNQQAQTPDQSKLGKRYESMESLLMDNSAEFIKRFHQKLSENLSRSEILS